MVLDAAMAAVLARPAATGVVPRIRPRLRKLLRESSIEFSWGEFVVCRELPPKRAGRRVFYEWGLERVSLRDQPVPNLIDAILHKPALKSY